MIGQVDSLSGLFDARRSVEQSLSEPLGASRISLGRRLSLAPTTSHVFLKGVTLIIIKLIMVIIRMMIMIVMIVIVIYSSNNNNTSRASEAERVRGAACDRARRRSVAPGAWRMRRNAFARNPTP